ncbi:MAG: hypothetical protein AAGH60_14845 [Pseudomonadota bacterium]
MFQNNLNLLVFFVSVLLVAVFTRGLAFLPERYYFTFSDLVSADNSTQFLADPELPTPRAFCHALDAKRYAIDENGEQLSLLTDGEQALLEPCSRVNRYRFVENRDFPPFLVVDGQSLNSDDYNRAVLDFIGYLQRSEALLQSALAGISEQQVNSLQGLSSIEIQRVLFQDDAFSMANLGIYLSGNPDIVWWDFRNRLREDPEFNRRLNEISEQQSIDYAGLRTRPEWVRLAEQHRNNILEADYETLRTAIAQNDGFVFLPAVLLKLMPALFAGIIMGLFQPARALYDTSIGAAFVALMLSWPVVILWEYVVSSRWQDTFGVMLALYAAYIVAYYFAARFGAMLAMLLRRSKLPPIIAGRINWQEVVATIIGTLITSGATAAITWTLASTA